MTIISTDQAPTRSESRLPQLSVVIPAFNEERRLVPAVVTTANYLGALAVDFEILIVDDGSTDRTPVVIQDLQHRFPQVRSIRLSANSGKGAAVKTGVLAASGALVLFTDADQSTSISQLPRVLRPVLDDSFDIAIGSRGLSASKVVVGQKPHRQVLARVFGLLTKLLLIRGFRDCQCGFKLFTREAALKTFPNVTSATAIFDMEVMLLASRCGLKIAEVPIEWSHDPDSRLTYGFVKALGLFKELLRMKFHWRVVLAERVDATEYVSDAIDPPEATAVRSHAFRARQL